MVSLRFWIFTRETRRLIMLLTQPRSSGNFYLLLLFLLQVTSTKENRLEVKDLIGKVESLCYWSFFLVNCCSRKARFGRTLDCFKGQLSIRKKKKIYLSFKVRFSGNKSRFQITYNLMTRFILRKPDWKLETKPIYLLSGEMSTAPKSSLFP